VHPSPNKKLEQTAASKSVIMVRSRLRRRLLNSVVRQWRRLLADASKSHGWLPGFLIVAGLFFLTAGLLSGGPDVVGGIVFGVVSLAAAAAILHRRAREAGESQSKDEAAEPGASADRPRDKR
jgi:hypothetical protein